MSKGAERNFYKTKKFRENLIVRKYIMCCCEYSQEIHSVTRDRFRKLHGDDVQIGRGLPSDRKY